MDTRVSRGTTVKLGVVEGDLVGEDRIVIHAEDGLKVTVKGKARFQGSVDIECSFECISLDAKHGVVRVEGHLAVNDYIDVEKALYSRGSVSCRTIDVGGKLVVGEALTADKVDVGGSVDVDSDAKCGKVDVGGSLSVRGSVNFEELDVGGSVEIGGGVVSETIDVGGILRAKSPLEFGRIDLGGIADLTGGKGKSIEVGGRLRSKGDLRCEDLSVGGVVDIDGTLDARRAEVGGRIRVTRDLTSSERLEVGGVMEVRGVLAGSEVEVGGSLRAYKAILSGCGRVGGSIETSQGLRAKSIELGDGGQAVGVLVASEVEIGSQAAVQDVYCNELRVDDGSVLGRVFAESAELGDNCVLEKIVYTKTLREGERVRYRSPPEKVESLPPFPV
jgi:cytoskeletal protein CcmA (bactofilin family)